jgi:tetratricopeptide (TPR) repeat protein
VSEPVVRLTAALGRRYVIERELGRGGMGTVYLARDLKHGRPVALKVLPPDVAAALGPERFLREIAISARLTHPHILPLHDSGHAAGLLYYVMPYVNGESLRDRLGRSVPLTIDEACEIATEVADALDHAHRQGVLHRDVKPENILLAGGHALLADFGVARALTPSPAELITDSGLAVGTAGYASPEQAAGSRAVDARTDIYSLGCVLYEMLVDLSPGNPQSARQALEGRFAEPLPPPRGLNPALPEWLDAVVTRALASRPADRFATAGELRDALRRTSETEPSPPVPPRKAPRRLAWMAAGALGLALVAAAFAFLPRRIPHSDPRQVVVAGFENRTGDSTLNVVGDIATDYIARGLATTRLMHEVYDARVAAQEAGERLRVDAAAGRALATRVGAGTVLWGNYYRDGDSLHFEAQVIDAATGKLIVSLQPAVGPLKQSTRVVETLRQRVMAGFVAVFGPGFEAWQAASIPPTYEAYQEMIAGSEAIWEFDYAEALRHYQRAIALDSSYTGAWTNTAFAASLGHDCGAVDSIVQRFKRLAEVLPPAERGQLEIAQASCRSDYEGALEATRRALQVVPHSLGFSVFAAVMASELLRPREALAMLEPLDLERSRAIGQPVVVARSWLVYAYHMAGDFAHELKVLRGSGDAPYPPDEAIALAGLGRVAEAERLAVSPLPPSYSGEHLWSAAMAACAALELRAHGHPEAGQRVLERVSAWFGPAAATSASTDDHAPCMWHHFSAAYYAGQWEEARQAYQQRLAEDTAGLKAHAALGALAARRHDADELGRMTLWLSARPDNFAALLARARISALLGNKEEAVRLLRQAFDHGLNGKMFLHIDPDFESLRNYPPYRELIRPKG